MIDLHVHSKYAPNGKLPLRDIFERGKAIGLSHIAITDSYCVDGVPEALELGKEYGIKAIKAVEMQADSRVHILAYRIDDSNEAFRKILKESREWVDGGRLEAVFRNMQEKYSIEVSLEEVCRSQNTKSPSTKQICSVLAEKGLASEWKDAKAKYFSPGSKNGSCYVGAKYTVEELVRHAKLVGGIAVLAHPHQIERNEVNIEELMPKLIASGLDGIEVYYNNQFLDEEKMRNAYKLKGDYGLEIISGGSDFDGEVVACLGGEPPILKEMVSEKLLEE